MSDDKVHKPSLPGVKTYAGDIKAGGNDENLGITFLEPNSDEDEKNMHAPEKTVATGKGAARGGGLGDTENALDVSGAFEAGLEQGTIITDKKERFGKPSDIAKSALKEWFGGVKKVVDKLEMLQKTEEPMMIPVEKRKAVISEAGKLTKQVPHDDHSAVVEKIKTTQKNSPAPNLKPVLLKEKPMVRAVPKWSHTIDESKPAPTTENTEEKFLKSVHDFRDEQKPATPPQEKIPSLAKQIPEEAVQEPTNTPKPIARESLQKRPQQKKVVQTEGVFRGPTSSNVSAVTKKHIEAAAVQEKKEKPKVDPEDRFELKRTTEPTHNQIEEVETAGETFLFPLKKEPGSVFHSEPLKREEKPEQAAATGPSSLLPHLSKTQIIILSAVVVVGAVGGGIAAFILSSSDPSNVAVTESEPIPAFFTADSLYPVSFSSQHDTFMNRLNSALAGSQGKSVQIYAVTSPLESEVVTLPTTEALFGAIADSANSAFIRSLGDTMMLGAITITKREPFIILQSNSFDTAFAGMLSWEPYMAEDLSPFFDTRTLMETVDADSKPVPVQRFSDATKQNRSIRILYDADGNERIIYAFVSRNTLIITETTDALAELIARLQ